MKKVFMLLLVTIFWQAAFCQSHDGAANALYREIVAMDSTYFGAYNRCDMATQAAIYSDSIEFYHDHGGLERSKQNLLASIQRNICGKVSRVLVPGSIEVRGIPGFGAIEMGYHKFINHAEHDAVSEPDRFIVFWRYRDGKWEITRVVSMHADRK